MLQYDIVTTEYFRRFERWLYPITSVVDGYTFLIILENHVVT
jgi:hypothetical protein